MKLQSINNLYSACTKDASIVRKVPVEFLNDIRNLCKPNRAFLQKETVLRSLNSIDYFNHMDYGDQDDLEYYDSYLSHGSSTTMPSSSSGSGSAKKIFLNPDSLKRQAMGLVTGMTFVNGFAGFATAQLGIGCWGLIAPVVGAMCTQISQIYDCPLKNTTMEALSASAKGFFRGAILGGALGHIPLIGNFANSASAVVLTQQIGKSLVNKFDKALRQSLRELEWYEKNVKLLSENEKLNRKQELINEFLEQMAKEEENNR